MNPELSKVNWHYRAFSHEEHTQRFDRAKQVLAQAGLAGCICVSPELIYYFSGYEAHTHHAIGSQAMVISVDHSTPILIIRDGDLPQAEETVVLAEVIDFRLGAIDLAQLIHDVLNKHGLSSKTLGIDRSAALMNGDLYLSLQQALPDCQFEDCWRMLGKLRTVLSDQEIDYVKQAAHYANIGIENFYQSARVGMSEIELAAEIEYAMRSSGSDYFAVPTWMASGERAWCQHAMASPRRLQPGDLVHAEFSGVARRYQCVTMGSLVLNEPSDYMIKMAEAGKLAYQAGLSAAKVGQRVGDMEKEYRTALAELGMADCCPMRFGVGISAAYPPIWENQITIQYESDDLLETGMVFYIHASMQSMSKRMGMLLGGSYLVTNSGIERLDNAPIELIVVDA